MDIIRGPGLKDFFVSALLKQDLSLAAVPVGLAREKIRRHQVIFLGLHMSRGRSIAAVRG